MYAAHHQGGQVADIQPDFHVEMITTDDRQAVQEADHQAAIIVGQQGVLNVELHREGLPVEVMPGHGLEPAFGVQQAVHQADALGVGLVRYGVEKILAGIARVKEEMVQVVVLSV